MKSLVDSFEAGTIAKRAWYRRRSFRLTIALALLVAAGTAAWSERRALLTAAGHWLDVGEPLREPVDCVFVLGGDADTRPFAAAALIRKGWARQALIAPSPTEGDEATHQAVLREVLLCRGVAEEAILELPRQVASTRDEALALRQFLEEHPRYSVAVLTSDYHTRRTRMIFRHQLAGRSMQVHIVSAPTERIKPTDWWQTEQGWKLYLGEYVKMISSLGR